VSVAVPRVGPSMRDAQRAAGALSDAGVPVVLLFGSVARGDQHADSDIDLVAVLDDLDYATRWRRRIELGELAGEASGRPVEVWVTDRPEWAHRSLRVATSFEAGIAGEAVVLCERPPNGVRWEKEIGMPASDFGEAAASLHNTNQALIELCNALGPGAAERVWHSERDPDGYLEAVAARLRAVCSRSQSASENALKALVHLCGDEPPGKVHTLSGLLQMLPDRLRPAAAAALAGLDLPEVSKWRQRGTYPADFPEMTLGDLVLAAHAYASAASAVGRLAAGQVADAAPAADVASRPAAGSPGREAATIARMCDEVEKVLAGWDFTRETPTARMGIPAMPETH